MVIGSRIAIAPILFINEDIPMPVNNNIIKKLFSDKFNFCTALSTKLTNPDSWSPFEIIKTKATNTTAG